MMCRTFFQLTALGEAVSSNEPLALPSERLWDDLVAELDGEDDFIGILDADDNVLQIMRRDDGYWVELPRFADRTSLGRMMNEEELQALLSRLPPRFVQRHFPDFQSHPW